MEVATADWVRVLVVVAVYTVVVLTVLVVVEVTTGIWMKLEQNDDAPGYRCKALTIALTSLHTWAGGRLGFGPADTAVHHRVQRDNLESILNWMSRLPQDVVD